MITEYITEQDILGCPYDPREYLGELARGRIDGLFSDFDGASLESQLVDLYTDSMMSLRRVVLEIVEVLEIGLIEKVRSEGLTKETFDTWSHIVSFIKMMPIEHEGNVLGEALAQLVVETPKPDESTASLVEAWAKVESKEK